MRIILVTGRKAESMVRDAVKDSPHRCEVLVQNIDIAAFSTPGSIRRALAEESGIDRSDTDLILVSGLCKADFSNLERELNTPVRLGPRNAYDLTEVLKHADKLEFSADVPADLLLATKMREDAMKELHALESEAKYKFRIKAVKIGGNARMKVCAELVDATLMPEDAIRRRIEYYIKCGADMVDIGIHMGASPEEVIRAVRTAREFPIPVSVDTMSPELLLAGIEAGADMVLSLNGANIAAVGDAIAGEGIAAVIVPDSDNATLHSLFTNIKKAQDTGIERIIADPVLDAAGYGIGASLHRYYLFRQRDRDTPLFFGVGNVTELIDADSTGVNAVLAGIAHDIGADILFTPEYSDKARGSVKELRVASEMMMLAKARGNPPKDLGIDLLILKEKRSKPVPGLSDNDVIEAEPASKWRRDPCGSFKIAIVEIGGRRVICAEHKPSGRRITGINAKEIMDTILRLNMVSLLEHAAYLSRELTKAELALQVGRSYEQDQPVFTYKTGGYR